MRGQADPLNAVQGSAPFTRCASYLLHDSDCGSWRQAQAGLVATGNLGVVICTCLTVSEALQGIALRRA